jgi:hypothetical protein
MPKYIPKLKRLNQSGFDHVLIAVACVVCVGLVGTYELFISHAATVPSSTITGVASKCIDDRYSQKTPLNKIQLYTCNGTGAQQWTVNGTATTASAIVNSNGYCLDVYGAHTTPGTVVDLYSCNDTVAQEWKINGINGTIVNPHSGLCLDDQWSGTADGTQIQIWGCNGTAAQKWTVHANSSTGNAGSGSGQGPTTGGSGSPSSPPAVSAGGFVTASGTNLMLDGNVVKFIGYDAYGMEGCWNGLGGSPWTNAQLDTYFASLPADGLTRIWTPESYGTSVLSNIVTQASKYNQHLVLSLGNDDGNCDPTADDPGQSAEPMSFYQGGWKTQYVAWVNKIVPLFANNPTIAMWEIANEPGQAFSVTTATMESYMSGAAAAIKADAPKQLVESGFNDTANAGGSVADYEAVQSSPNLNVISFHDYAYDYEGKAMLSGHFTDAQQAAKALNKPFIVGEVGVEAGSSSCASYLTQSQRVTYFETKANDYLKGIGPSGSGSPAASGVMFWDYVPEGPGATCSKYNYDITPTDPVVSMVQRYVAP